MGQTCICTCVDHSVAYDTVLLLDRFKHTIHSFHSNICSPYYASDCFILVFLKKGFGSEYGCETDPDKEVCNDQSLKKGKINGSPIG